MNTYRTYRCEFRINIKAGSPEEAARKAEEFMRGTIPSCWTVIDEHGGEWTFTLLGAAITASEFRPNHRTE